MGPLLFSLGIHKILDDGAVAGKGEEVEKVMAYLEPNLASVGLSINRSKCEWISRSTMNFNVPHTQENLVILGSPIGDKLFSENYISKKYSKWLELLTNLRELGNLQIELIAVLYVIQQDRVHTENYSVHSS